MTVGAHTISGGLSSAATDVLGEHRPTRLHRIGLYDLCPESVPTRGCSTPPG